MTNSILIVGTGALATLFAHRLSMAGIEVSVLGTWREGLAALEQEGAREDDAAGKPLRVMIDPQDCRGVRYALVLVKSWQTERAARQLEACLDAGGLAVTLQNGLGNADTLAEILGKERVGRGITTIGATLIGPGHVHLGGVGKVVLEKGDRTAALEAMLQRAGLEVESFGTIESQIWGKLVLNAAINPLTALLGVKNGRLLEMPAAKALLFEIGNEAAAVARLEGITLPYPDVEAALEDVARRSGDNVSSMLQDVLRGNQTEVDAINGKVVQAGERHSFQAGINRLMTLLVKSLSERGKINAVNIG